MLAGGLAGRAAFAVLLLKRHIPGGIRFHRGKPSGRVFVGAGAPGVRSIVLPDRAVPNVQNFPMAIDRAGNATRRGVPAV